MRSMWVVALLASACYRPAAIDTCTVSCDYAGQGSDAPCPSGLECLAGGVCGDHGGSCGAVTDAMIPDAAPCSGVPIGHDLIQLCLATKPPSPMTLPATIATDGDALCDPRFPTLCVVLGSDIKVTNTDVRATGSKP